MHGNPAHAEHIASHLAACVTFPMVHARMLIIMLFETRALAGRKHDIGEIRAILLMNN